MSDLNRKNIVVLVVIGIILLASIGIVLLILLQKETSEYSLRFLELQDDTPIEGVKVDILKHLYDEGYYTFDVSNDYTPYTREFVKTVHSDSEGWLNISLPKIPSRRGYYLFIFEKEGYMSRSGHSIFRDLNAKDSWTPRHESSTIYFCTPANVSGMVRDEAGNPVSGVTLSVRYKNLEIDNFDITDADGRYSIENTRSGLVDLTISGSGITTKNTTTTLDKFSDSELDIVVSRSSAPLFNVTIDPNLEYGGKLISMADNEMALFFIIKDRVLDVEYCWGTAMLKDGNFSLKVPEGNYDLKWYYLGNEDYNRIDVPHVKREYPANQLSIISDVDIEVDVELDLMPPDD